MIGCAILWAGGCASDARSGVKYEHQSSWQWRGIVGRQLQTEHYSLHTTLSDQAMVDRLAQVMEAAYRQYVRLVPVINRSPRKLPLFIFQTYDQWAEYTQTTTGEDSAAYLSVLNGGYAVGDRFVCWVSNEHDTRTTAAHEGWHQFVSVHFRMRLPPTLEEGLACTFENVSMRSDGVFFDRTHNLRRQRALRDAVEGDYLIPLETLILLHAGDLRDRSQAVREAYYGQAWALVVLLETRPEYREGFLNMLQAVASGNTPLDIGHNDGSQVYYPSRIKPFLQQYVIDEWSRFEQDYESFVREKARIREPGERP